MNNYREFDNYVKEYPSKDGFFGEHGGAYLPPELVPAFEEADKAYEAICHSAQFINELRRIRKEFQGRPTPVYHCERLSQLFGNCQIYLKREDLNHTGAHKLNHCMGEGLLAKYMGKKKLIAETGAGQHGVAIATCNGKHYSKYCDTDHHHRESNDAGQRHRIICPLADWDTGIHHVSCNAVSAILRQNHGFC